MGPINAVRIDDLAESYERHLKLNKRPGTQKRFQTAWKHLEPFFGGMKVTHIVTDDVETYSDKRLGEGASLATINVELSMLRAILRAGQKRKKLEHVPYIPLFTLDNVRTGFFEHHEYLALMEKLPDYLKPLIQFAYHYGWRLSEILSLTWDNVDTEKWIVRIEGDKTKNKEAKIVYLSESDKAAFQDLHRRGRWFQTKNVFVRWGKNVRPGPIKHFGGAFNIALKNAGLKGKIFHDFRRTAVRNLKRMGFGEREIMAMTGHKTQAVFMRYNLTDEKILQDMAQRMDVYFGSGTVSGTVTN